MKRKHRRLSEVQIESSDHSLPPLLAGDGVNRTFMVRLPHGASVQVPTGFDADELFSLLVVIQEAIT